MLREPVNYKAEGWDVTIDRVIADRHGTQVAVTIYGPFKMTEWKHNEYILYEKNPNYRLPVKRSLAYVTAELPRRSPDERAYAYWLRDFARS